MSGLGSRFIVKNDVFRAEILVLYIEYFININISNIALNRCLANGLSKVSKIQNMNNFPISPHQKFSIDISTFLVTYLLSYVFTETRKMDRYSIGDAL